jgi:hypothetical protein
MLGIFIAYFVTIVLFAGMYLTINKVGAAYVDREGNTVSDAKYCGMDINNHMEGEFWGANFFGPRSQLIIHSFLQHYTSPSAPWPRLDMEPQTIILAIVGHPLSWFLFKSFQQLCSPLSPLDFCSNECHGDRKGDALLSLAMLL